MNANEIDREIKWWQNAIRLADKRDKRELAFILWGICTGLKLAKDIYDEAEGHD